MAAERLSMRKIKEFLRLQAAGHSNRSIARSLGISHSTARQYRRGVEARDQNTVLHPPVAGDRHPLVVRRNGDPVGDIARAEGDAARLARGGGIADVHAHHRTPGGNRREVEVADDDRDGAVRPFLSRERGDQPPGRRIAVESIEQVEAAVEGGDQHGPTVSQEARFLGQQGFVAGGSVGQHDRVEERQVVQQLARWGRADPKLLSPIRHRSEAAQGDLALIRARDALVRTRSTLVSHLRGSVKSTDCHSTT
jgi:hypothetical protein